MMAMARGCCALLFLASAVHAQENEVHSGTDNDIILLQKSLEIEKESQATIKEAPTGTVGAGFGGYGAELAATIQKDCFYHLEAPISRVAGWDTPYPHAFEWQYFPGLKRMSAGIQRVMEVRA